MLAHDQEVLSPEHDPVLGHDGYPSDLELERIRCWPLEGWADLLSYVEARWHHADCGYWERRDTSYLLHTAGWSGNESLVQALARNRLFWSCCWVWSRRGGHHALELPSWVASGADTNPGHRDA